MLSDDDVDCPNNLCVYFHDDLDKHFKLNKR
jgi:hypothetical protein